MKTILWLVFSVMLVLVGCASSPKPRLTKSEIQKINWSERIGSYTYAEALADMGRPAVTGGYGEGRSAEWILKRSPQISVGFGVGGGSYGGGVGAGVGMGSTVTPPPSGEYLRLRFDKDDKLAEWSKVKY